MDHVVIEHSIGWGTGVDARLGKGGVFLGAGGGPRWRADVGEHVDVDAEARWLTLAGSTWLGRAGAGLHLSRGPWQPGAGLDVAVFWGASLRAITAENPDLVADLAPVLQLRLDPLHFSGERWSAGVLRLQVGSGIDRGEPALSFGVTVVDAAIRF